MSRSRNPELARFQAPPALARVFAAAGLLLAAASGAHAQGRGQAEFALQGYYLNGNQQFLNSTSGLALHFQDFLPHIGLLSGSLEGYTAQNRLVTGDNFLELRGAPWIGYHWTVTGGDFHAPAYLVEFPFYNIFTPEITARGFRVLAQHGDTQYMIFLGEETLAAGPRVPYRIIAPQTVAGAGAVHKIGRYLRVGARFMQFHSSPSQIEENPEFFPPGRDQGFVRTFSVQSLYTPDKRLKIYAEVSRPLEQRHAVTSSIAGAAWESKSLTFRLNYVLQGVQYFPLAGYFVGDRRGPFAEVHLHPWKRIDLYGSASRYRNNLENDPAAVSLDSTSGSAGLTAALPAKFSFNGQVSVIRFTTQQPGDAPVASNNRQIEVTLARSLGRHNLHLSVRDLKLVMPPASQRQRSVEIEDMYQLRHFFIGGSARWQRASGADQRNSIYLRGSFQANVGRLSAYANVEGGKDLANRTIFATNTYSTTVLGIGLRLFRGWNLQAEAFRNRLNMDLNPENIFLLQGGGIPISETLAALSQWSLYFRLSKQIQWGGGLPNEKLDQFAANAVPLTGILQGVVSVRRLAGPLPGQGIPISLDGQRTAITGADGRYVFNDVPEGEHQVGLSLPELPADYDPVAVAPSAVLVRPRQVARADFAVLPLTSVQGRVTGPEGTPLEGIVIRMHPGERYTTTSKDGRFTFYNVREGDYEFVLDAKTLPENAALHGVGTIAIAVRLGEPVPPLSFSIAVGSTEKPVRKVLERR